MHRRRCHVFPHLLPIRNKGINKQKYRRKDDKMKKLLMGMIGVATCSVMTGCISEASSKGGTYANLPDPKPDEYQIHWENEENKIEMSATACGGWFGVFGKSDNTPWMLRDQEQTQTFGPFNMGRIYTTESKARNAALYKACQQAKCDALIGAMYEVKSESFGPFFEVSRCTVKGWPARIIGIEKVSNKAK